MRRSRLPRHRPRLSRRVRGPHSRSRGDIARRGSPPWATTSTSRQREPASPRSAACASPRRQCRAWPDRSSIIQAERTSWVLRGARFAGDAAVPGEVAASATSLSAPRRCRSIAVARQRRPPHTLPPSTRHSSPAVGPRPLVQEHQQAHCSAFRTYREGPSSQGHWRRNVGCLWGPLLSRREMAGGCGRGCLGAAALIGTIHHQAIQGYHWRETARPYRRRPTQTMHSSFSRAGGGAAMTGVPIKTSRPIPCCPELLDR